MRSTPIPEIDTGAVRAACAQRVVVAEAASGPALVALLDRLTPERWSLEWHLPWWLGHTFGLAPDLAFELVVSDVLGLASVRLEDDIADGQVPSEDVESSRRLARMLFEEALRPYHAWFEPGHALWARIDRWMAEWRAASDDPDVDADDPRRLAARANPLRIPAFATCALAGRDDAIGTLDRVLDHALAALVQWDHLADWEDDLAAGRWNAFVAACSPRPQTPGQREAHHVAVRVALMTDGAAAVFGRRIEAELERAAELSEPLTCAPLTAYLRDEAAGAARQGLEVDAHYREVAERAAELLFGRPDVPVARLGLVAAATDHAAHPGRQREVGER